MQLAEFALGQVVGHYKYGYRGIVVDVDPSYQGSEEWYEQTADSRPAKNRPWYYVLADGYECETYVAEEHLFADETTEPMQHPELDSFLKEQDNGRYTTLYTVN